jgi:hypothetical protein
VSTGTVPGEATAQTMEPDTVELHVRNVPRAVWLKARNAALVSRLRFGQYVIKLLENANPVSPPDPSIATVPAEGYCSHQPDSQDERATNPTHSLAAFQDPCG